MELTVTIGADGEPGIRVQIHDDLVAGFVPLAQIKAFVEVFVDPEDFEFPVSMVGLVAFEIRREGASHFTARFGVLEDIRVSSPEPDRMSVDFDRDLSLGSITLNGPGQLIDGALQVDPISVRFGWQDVVDLFHDDEDEVEQVCHDNEEQEESCRVFRHECRPGCDEDEACLQACDAAVDPEVRGAYSNFDACAEAVPACDPGEACDEDQCNPHDEDCLRGKCGEAWARIHEVCNRREWCEEVRTPAPEAPEVEGLLSIFVPGASGSIHFTGADDVLALDGLGLGDETLHITVNEDRIVGVDLNPDAGRRLGLSLSATPGEGMGIPPLPNDNIRLQVSPSLDVRAMFAIHHVRQALPDFPDFMESETVTVRFAGSDAPTLESIGDNGSEWGGGDDDRKMRVASGRLTLGSTAMPEDVVIEEGMCMGSDDGEDLSEDDRDARHDLFGELVSEACDD